MSEGAADVKETKSADIRASEVFIVSDSGGFVGAYLSRDELARQVTGKYPSVRFVIHRFPLNEQLSAVDIYLVLYVTCDAVALATNDVAECRRVHGALRAVGMTYEDEADYLRHPTNIICAPSKKRLDTLTVALDMYAPESAAKIADADVTIMNCVIESSSVNTAELFDNGRAGSG